MFRARTLLVLLSAVALIALPVIGCGDEAGDSESNVRPDSSAAAESGAKTGGVANRELARRVEGLDRVADGEDAEQAFDASERYLSAYRNGQWTRGCALMTSSMKTRLARTVGKHPRLEGKGCPAILAAIAGGVPREIRRRQAKAVSWGELRFDGGQGYVLFDAADGHRRALRMQRVDGQWRVATVAGEPIG